MIKRRKFALLVCAVSVVFIIYQLKILEELVQIASKVQTQKLRVLGTHEYQVNLYEPNEKRQFVCFVSMEEIEFSKLNDDYCDCQDGTDEPGTNACSNGQFFCTLQVDAKGFIKILPSSKVNDGICDCCDGSDEWKNKSFVFGFRCK